MVPIFIVVAVIIALYLIVYFTTKKGLLGDVSNILYWLLKKAWTIIGIIFFICIAILVVGGVITFFSP